MSHKGRYLHSCLGALFIFVVTGCGHLTNRATPNSESSESLAISEDQLLLLQKEALIEIRQDFPALKDRQVQDYVSSVGEKLVLANQLADRRHPYSFTVVSSPYPNAFALPAGAIFITDFLLEQTDSEAELAGILGHEIAHVIAQHAGKRLVRQREEKSKSWLFGAGGVIVGGVVGAGVASVAEAHGLSSSNSEGLLLTSATAGLTSGLLLQKYLFLENTTEQELEADRVSFQLMRKAGYSSEAVGRFYFRMVEVDNQNQSNLDSSKNRDILAKTHPPSQRRLSNLEELAKLNPAPNDSLISTPIHKQVLDHLKTLTRFQEQN